MAISVSIQYNGGLLPDSILLAQCYLRRGTRSGGLTNAFYFQISRKFPRFDKNKNTRFLNAICQILKSNFPRFKRSSTMLKVIL